MTVFLVYALPSSSLSLLTLTQAEIPGQEQDGYDTEPNFFHGMHQVRAIAYLIPFFLTSFITAFSNFPTTTSTAPWASQKTQARYDENPPFSSPTSSYTCITYYPITNLRSYPYHSSAWKSIPPEV
jgi:hypothetical protein